MEHKLPDRKAGIEKGGKNFHIELQCLMDAYVNKVYDYTQGFPREETFGLTSQYRRAALSVALNYIEGYARQRKNVFKNFVEIAYGSLKESEYLTKFAFERNMLPKKHHEELLEMSDRIGAMLWGILSKLK